MDELVKALIQASPPAKATAQRRQADDLLALQPLRQHQNQSIYGNPLMAGAGNWARLGGWNPMMDGSGGMGHGVSLLDALGD